MDDPLMISLLDGIKMGAAGIAAAALVAGGMTLYDRTIDDPAVFQSGRKEGVAAERLAWEQLRVDMLRDSAAKLKQAQDKIDAAERKYFLDRAGDALKILALEEAIREANQDATPPADRPPAFSRGVSRALNKIGR